MTSKEIAQSFTEFQQKDRFIPDITQAKLREESGLETLSGFLQFMVYKSTLILVLPISYGLLAGNKYLSHCQRTVVYLVLTEFWSPLVCFYRRYDGCNYRNNNMHGYSITALRIRQQRSHPSSMHATTVTVTSKWIRSLQKCAEIYLYKSLGSTQIKSYPSMPVVLE